MLDLAAPVLSKFCTLEVEVGKPRIIGTGRFGERRMIPITGGRVSGAGISGVILNGGADWQTVNPDGLTELTARYAFETDDGALIEIVNTGFRHGPKEIMGQLASGEPVSPLEYYMRSTAKLETGHPEYVYLNKLMFVGTGARNAALIQIDLYTVG